MDTHSNEEITTRQSSKLSLGSSPSVLSADEQLEGDGPLTPTDKMEDDEEDDEEDDDDLSALNSILQAGSPGSLSNEEVSDDDLHTEQDSASPLSSVPDDFPLSRSASPELPMVEPMETLREEEEDEEEEEEEQVEKKKLPPTRKRRNKEDVSSPNKKTKSDKVQPAIEDQKLIEESSIRKRRASRSITNNIITEPLTRPRRRQSRQDEQVKEQENEQVLEDKSNDDDEEEEEEGEEETETKNDDEEEEGGGKLTENNRDTSSDDLKKSLLDTPTEQNGDCEDTKMISEPQENDDHDYQQRHKEALDALTHIEVEFARLRDKMYEEKMSELNEEAMMIANGTHPELVTLMAEIEEKKGKRIHSAEAWRKHQHANFKQQFEGFEYQANIHFISQKNALRRDLLSSINGKRWNIEDERTKLNDPARTDRVFPDGREMVAHKREQKEETGELQDIKETAGFPMAPIPTGLSLQDVEDDLKILGINRNL
ncbi:Sds3-like-domain-containing protein [Thamnidium elegans]|nr:Sds3-like-domain-containing protein [Thamnidium elegans]